MLLEPENIVDNRETIHKSQLANLEIEKKVC